MKYTTLSAVQAKLVTPPSNPVIENAIELVSGYIDTYLGFKLAKNHSDATTDFKVDGSGTEYLVLNQPLNAFTSLERTFMNLTSAPEQYIASYPLNEPYTTYVCHLASKFQAGMANYVFKNARVGMFKVDFATPANHTLPNEIKEVATALAVAMCNSGGGILANSSQDTEKSGKITSETIGSYSASYANDSTSLKSVLSSVPNATDILTKYKQVVIV